MGKLSTVLAVGTIVAGTSAAGVWVFNGQGKGTDLPETLEKFKKSSTNTCTKNYFPGLKIGEGSQEKLESSFFTTSETPTPQEESCLIVNWERKDYEDDKWTGNFRWLWSFKKGNKGFVMFTVAETKKSGASPQLDLSGGVYFVSKNDGEDWKVSKYQELSSSDNKSISSADLGNKFPSVGDKLNSEDANFKTNNPHWGFISNGTDSGSSDFGKICTSSDSEKCTDEKVKKTTAFVGHWVWKVGGNGGDTGTIPEWSKNWSTWFTHMYDSDKANISSESPFSTTKTNGSWNGKVKKTETPSNKEK